MNFIAHLFWNHLPYVETEVRYINGKEQVCLVIPTEANQIKRGRQGNWLSVFRLSEVPINPKLITHDVQLGYLNWDEVYKARRLGYYNKSQRLGRVRIHDRTPSKKVDRTNNASGIRYDGVVCLSDIPLKFIRRNAENNKRYVRNLRLSALNDNSRIYTGTICIDDIPQFGIKTDSYTGKKNVYCVFKKLDYLDTYMNTHQLVIVDGDGSEIEIGRFKEWSRESSQASSPITSANQISDIEKENHPATVNPRPAPMSIDGIKF